MTDTRRDHRPRNWVTSICAEHELSSRIRTTVQKIRVDANCWPLNLSGALRQQRFVPRVHSPERSFTFRHTDELLAKWSNGQRRSSWSDGRTFHQSEFWHLALDAREQFQRMWKLEVRWNGWNDN